MSSSSSSFFNVKDKRKGYGLGVLTTASRKITIATLMQDQFIIFKYHEECKHEHIYFMLMICLKAYSAFHLKLCPMH